MSEALPTVERVVKDVVAPPYGYLDSAALWSGPDGSVNIEVLKDWFFREGKLSPDDYAKIMRTALEVLKKEPNCLTIDGSVTVCGDIHGQFFDLLKLFEVGGDVTSTIYLFLGDYVDRGAFGIECTAFLMANKINNPNSFFMLRGNHECRHLTDFFNFHQEARYKYNDEIYDLIMEVFDALPLAAVVNNRFFCCHGGLSPNLATISDIQTLERFQEPPQSGAMCDLLWADPIEDESDKTLEFTPNVTRGCSWFFGYASVAKFLKTNGLLSVLRAHEAQIDGYKMHCKRPNTEFPLVITLFSAPNYCDVYANKGAILKYHNNLMNIRQFNCSPHPYSLPNFMNVFEWSMPFVGDKIAEFCTSIASSVTQDEDEAAPEQESKEIKDVMALKNKIRSAAKFSVMLKALRENSADILKIKQEMPDNKIPPGLLQKGTAEIKKVRESFDTAKDHDRINERRPSREELVRKKDKRFIF